MKYKGHSLSDNILQRRKEIRILDDSLAFHFLKTEEFEPYTHEDAELEAVIKIESIRREYDTLGYFPGEDYYSRLNEQLYEDLINGYEVIDDISFEIYLS